MKISIVIPNYNNEELLISCLRSIYQQSFINHTDYEIIIVDNNSDYPFSILTNNFNRSRVIKLNKNVGFSRAVNIGIKESNAKLILVLNNDTILKSDSISRIFKASQMFPNYGFYALKIINYKNHAQVDSTGLMFSNRGYGNRTNRYLLADVNKPTEVFGACGAAAVYRKNAIEKAGLFNEEFFIFYEDIELSFRLQLLGYNCLYVPDVNVYHHGSATLNRFLSLKIKEGIKNSVITLITCMPFYFLKKNLLSILYFYFKLFINIISANYKKEFTQGIIYVLKNIKTILARRKKIQGQILIKKEYLESLFYNGNIEINFPSKTLWL